MGRWRDERGADVLDEDRTCALAGEGRDAGEHLVERRAQRVEVAAVVDLLLPERLLGGHVVGRPVGVAGARERPLADAWANEPEVAELGEALRGDQDVARLDVAVDEARGVGVLEGAGDLGGEVDRLLLGETPLLAEDLLERAALDVFHDEVAAAAALADLDRADDVRMGEAPGGARLAIEALDVDRVLGEALGEDLDRDDAVEGELPGLVDGARRALRDLGEDLVPVDRGPVGGGLDLLVQRSEQVAGETAFLEEDLAEALRFDAEVLVLPLESPGLQKCVGAHQVFAQGKARDLLVFVGRHETCLLS